MPICLIGEADWFLAQLLRRFGEASGFEVLRAETGQELLQIARASKPVVIIAETELPGTLRGWQAIRAIASDPALAHIPVITCSWLTADEAQARVGIQAGHLQKPGLNYSAFCAALTAASIDLPSRLTGSDS